MNTRESIADHQFWQLVEAFPELFTFLPFADNERAEHLSVTQLKEDHSKDVARRKLRHSIEKSGKLVPSSHFIYKYLSDTLSEIDNDLPKGIEFWVVDGDGKEMFYSGSANVVVIGKGFLKFFIQQSEKRWEKCPPESGQLTNIFAQLLKKSNIHFSTAHIAEVVKHEIRHGLQREQEDSDDDVDTEWSLTKFIGDRHKNEYDADIYAMRSSAKKYNPWALVDFLWLAQVDFGKQSWSHPDAVDRIRVLEQFLTDDKTALPNTAQQPTPIPPPVYKWIMEDSKAYTNTDKWMQMNADELHLQVLQAKTPMDAILATSFWQHEKILEEARGIMNDQLVREVTLHVLVRKSLESYIWHTFGMATQDYAVHNSAIESVKKTLDHIKYRTKEKDFPDLSADRAVMVPEALEIWFGKTTTRESSEQTRERIEKFHALLVEEAQEILTGMEEVIDEPSTPAEILPELLLRMNVLKSVLEGNTNTLEIGELLKRAFPHYYDKFDSALHRRQSSSSKKDYQRNRDKRDSIYSTDYIWDFDDEKQILDTFQLSLMSMSIFLTHLENDESHVKHLSQLFKQLTTMSPAYCDLLAHALLTRGHLDNILFKEEDPLKLWQIYDMGTRYLADEVAACLSPENKSHTALKASRGVVFNFRAANYFFNQSGEHNTASRGLNGYHPVFTDAVGTSAFCIGELYSERKRSKNQPTYSADPFDSSNPLKIAQMIEIINSLDSSPLRTVLNYYSLRKYLDQHQAQQPIDPLVTEIVTQVENLPSGFTPPEILTLLHIGPWDDEKKAWLISSWGELLNQHLALTGDKTTLEVLTQAYHLGKSDSQKRRLEEFISGALTWYHFSRNDALIPFISVEPRRSRVDTEYFLDLYETGKQFVSQPEHWKRIKSAISNVFQVMDEHEITLRLKSFHDRESDRSIQPSTRLLGNPNQSALDKEFFLDFIEYLALMSPEQLEEVIQLSEQLLNQTFDQEHFSFTEELKLLQLFSLYEPDCSKRDQLFVGVKNRFSDRSYDGPIDRYELAFIVLKTQGPEAYEWVLSNFHPSQERDELLLLIALDEENAYTELSTRYSELIVSPIDSGNFTVNTTQFSWRIYQNYKSSCSNQNQPMNISLFKQTGIIGKQFDNLLYRRHDFSCELLVYPGQKNSTESTRENGSYHQQFIGKRMLQLEPDFMYDSLSFSEKVNRLSCHLSSPCLMRDQYLEIMTRDELSKTSTLDREIEVIDTVLDLFTHESTARQRVAARKLSILISQNKYPWTSYQEGLEIINHYLPSQTLVRKHFLEILAVSPVKISSQEAKELEQQMYKSATGKDDLLADSILFINLISEFTRAEKFNVLCWLLGLTRTKPLSVIDLEEEFDGTLDSFPQFFQSLYPPEIESITKRLLLGEEGVLDLDAVTPTELKDATELKTKFLHSFAEHIIPVDLKGSRFLRDALHTMLNELPSSYASNLLYRILSAYQEAKSLHRTLSVGELTAVALAEFSTPGIKVGQSIGDFQSLEREVREPLQKIQEFAGRPISPVNLYAFLDAEQLLTTNNHGFVVQDIEKLLGDASNKQGALLSVEIESEQLRAQLGMNRHEKSCLAVGRFKRPSTQKTSSMEAYFNVGLKVLELAKKYYKREVPPRFLETIRRATDRELNLRAEAEFSTVYKRYVEQLQSRNGITHHVPLVIYTSDNLIIETVAPGNSLRAVTQETSFGVDQERNVYKEVLLTLLLGLLEEGLLHADPTKSNIFYDSEKKILSFLDRGMHTYLNERERAASLDLLIGLQTNNLKTIKKACNELGWKFERSELPKFGNRFFENAEALMEAITHSKTEVSDTLSSIAFVLFKMKVYFEKLTTEDMSEISERLREKLQISTWSVVSRFLFS